MRNTPVFAAHRQLQDWPRSV